MARDGWIRVSISQENREEFVHPNEIESMIAQGHAVRGWRYDDYITDDVDLQFLKDSTLDWMQTLGNYSPIPEALPINDIRVEGTNYLVFRPSGFSRDQPTGSLIGPTLTTTLFGSGWTEEREATYPAFFWIYRQLFIPPEGEPDRFEANQARVGEVIGNVMENDHDPDHDTFWVQPGLWEYDGWSVRIRRNGDVVLVDATDLPGVIEIYYQLEDDDGSISNRIDLDIVGCNLTARTLDYLDDLLAEREAALASLSRVHLQLQVAETSGRGALERGLYAYGAREFLEMAFMSDVAGLVLTGGAAPSAATATRLLLVELAGQLATLALTREIDDYDAIRLAIDSTLLALGNKAKALRTLNDKVAPVADGGKLGLELLLEGSFVDADRELKSAARDLLGVARDLYELQQAEATISANLDRLNDLLAEIRCTDPELREFLGDLYQFLQSPGLDPVFGERRMERLDMKAPVEGTGGEDTLEGTGGADLLLGGGGADDLRGLNLGDGLFGGGGRDVLAGNRGDDLLAGERGNDVLRGGQGADTLTGGHGQDRLFGGNGADTFVLDPRERGVDRIRDFEIGTDRLALAGGSDAALEVHRQGGQTVVSVGDDVLAVLAGVTAAEVNQGDWTF